MFFLTNIYGYIDKQNLQRTLYWEKYVKIFSFSSQNDYGSPLLNENTEVIGIVSHVPILSLRPILFVRINEVAPLIESWKRHLKRAFHYDANKRRKIF